MRMAPQHAAPTPAAPAQRSPIQMKTRIGPVDDPLEREADRVADAIVSSRPIDAIGGAPPATAQRKCADCEQEEKTAQRKRASCGSEDRLQAKSADATGNDASHNGASLTPEQRAYFEPRFGRDFSAPASVDQVLASPGRPLERALRQDMEQRFGHDFSQVRVHTGAAAGQSARTVNAKAYTVGQNIVFEPGRFAPGSQEGRGLIAHELTHVVQADLAASVPKLPPSSVAALEREARQVANAVRGNSVIPPIQGSAQSLAVPLRQGKDDPGTPTFSNLPRDEPILTDAGGRPIRRVELVEEGGVWYEKLGRAKFRANGSYDFVVRGGKILAVKGSSAVGAVNPGHTEAAGGGPVKYAGRITFGTSKIGRGTLLEWSNASGHYAPVKEFAKAAGLPIDKRFKPLVGEKPPMGPQLPAFQLKKGEILEPRGRGGDAKRLGTSKVEPVPQKTIVKGEFEAKTTPTGKPEPVETTPEPTKTEPTKAEPAKAAKTPPAMEAEASLTETTIAQEFARISEGRGRVIMGKIARVGGLGFAALKVGGILYTIYSLTQIRSLSDAGAFVVSLGVGAAISGATVAARLGTGVGLFATFALSLDDTHKPSQEETRRFAVYHFLEEHFTFEEFKRNRMQLESQAYALLFDTKPFELVPTVQADIRDSSRAMPDYVECSPEMQCSPDHSQWLAKMRPPLMRSVREEAAAIRTHLMADPDKTSGAVLASENLAIAQQTTDPKVALQAVESCLSFLNYDKAFYPYPQLRSMRHTLLTIVG